MFYIVFWFFGLDNVKLFIKFFLLNKYSVGGRRGVVINLVNNSNSYYICVKNDKIVC